MAGAVAGGVAAGSSGGADDRLWVVVPAYNEGAVLAGVIGALRGSCRNVVVVDDGSADDTSAVAAANGAYVVRHPINLGQGAAIGTGIHFGLERGAQYIATFDADGQHRVEDLIRMFDELRRSGADIALGSRFLGEVVGIPRARVLMLRMATWVTNLSTGVRLTDTHNGLRVMTASTAQRLDIRQNRMAHASEIIRAVKVLNLKHLEIPVNIQYTAYSLAKGQRIRDAGRVLGDLLGDWISR